jgi:hypothetical protein
MSPRKRRNMFKFGGDMATPKSSMMAIDDGNNGVIEGPGTGKRGDIPTTTPKGSLIPKLNLNEA